MRSPLFDVAYFLILAYFAFHYLLYKGRYLKLLTRHQNHIEAVRICKDEHCRFKGSCKYAA